MVEIREDDSDTDFLRCLKEKDKQLHKGRPSDRNLVSARIREREKKRKTAD